MANKVMKKLVILVVAFTLVNQVNAQNTVRATLAYPTGDPASSGLLVNKSAPAEVMLNQSYEYSLEACNKTNSTLFSVVIQESLPEGFMIQSTSPEAEIKDHVVTWKIEAFCPGAKQQFTITGLPSGVGDLISCTSATYCLHACVLTKVLQPELKLSMKGPKVVLKCDPIIVEYEVTNNGTGTTRNVVVNHRLPKGLTNLEGGPSAVFNIDSLAPGKSTSFRKLLKADQAGRYYSEAIATADGGLQSSVKMDTKVVMPVLTVDVSGPEKVYLSRKVTYLFKVTNTGDGLANNVSLISNVPGNVRIDSISENGSRMNNQIIWDRLGTLMPNQAVTARLTVEPQQRGVVDVSALAKATCALDVKSSTKTLVEGIPAILLEVIDLSDPVAVGEEVTYLIKVTNQGSADGTNILVLAELENSMQYVSSQGPTSAHVSGNFIRFDPLPQLSPKQIATWQIKAKAVRSGDVRFGVKLQSDQIKRSVDETEATNFYE